MLSQISKFILSLLGWKITGAYPHHIDKFIIIVAPHTSNWDFPLGLLVRSAIKAKISFIGKSSLFKPPHGFIFRWLGGYPVDRTKNNNLVDSVVNLYNSSKKLTIVITPEGTRKKVEKIKTGFYFIAKGANIPILPVKFDFEHKDVNFGNLFYPTADKDADIEHIVNYYRGVKGKRPDQGIS